MGPALCGRWRRRVGLYCADLYALTPLVVLVAVMAASAYRLLGVVWCACGWLLVLRLPFVDMYSAMQVGGDGGDGCA